ncbi:MULTISPECIES: exodeoxyribonuclease V subunit gamma [unclassified Arsukibacterium]|uniref:exodeoxyribonuclease V subunit gamma n=1 Tax=unclassified Arsukibacterium TaxID=2635278 RepID=UPI000C4A771A|nr:MULTISPECIES: exodeoxyribonuclease V subunit gamma [unclassified Arsukibacterium]MBM33877.1 exodeoxyribonuclease V subunit gamma [Rheinheimera sp.]|tara:strand:- start:5894 stop:9382 length:3489 start_codon:yes stop_codon:yes gene_type:complete
MSQASSLQAGFLVVHANAPEQLRAVVVNWLQRYPLSPLESEQILVQSNGIAQWLKLALASEPDASEPGCGIAAAINVQLPARFIWQLYRKVLGADQISEHSAYSRELLRWHLLSLLPQLPDNPCFAPLKHFYADDPTLVKTYQLAEQLAALYDQYQVYRADWLNLWQQQQDILVNARGQQSALQPEQLWQSELWRLLHARISEQQLGDSRAEIHQRFIDKLARLSYAQAIRLLPRRLIIFGISAMPQQSLQVLAAIAPFCQVLLAVHNPCQHYWADIVSEKELLRAEQHRQSYKVGMPQNIDEEQLYVHAQPLLASWGRQGRDYIRLLDEFDETARFRNLFLNQKIDLFQPPDSHHLLGMLQHDIYDLRPVHESQQHWPSIKPTDQSVQFHMAHSAMREVEILHDQLLAAFEQDHSLSPREIMVMVPDIASYAPLIQAVFASVKPDDPRYIPFAIADLPPGTEQPMFKAVEQLLALPQSRFQLSDILDLLEVPAVRQRFAIEETAIPLIHQWLYAAGARWGLDSAQRHSLDLPADLHQFSWQFAIDRMLLGFATGPVPATEQADAGWYGIEPFTDISGLDAASIGPLYQLLAQLKHYWHLLQQTHNPERWQEIINAMLQDFLLPQQTDEQALLAQLYDALDEWHSHCQQAALTSLLPAPIVAESWLALVAQPGVQQRFLSGGITFATLLPMRAIPFRHICLLGMNDGAFPRQQPRQDFDLMRTDMRPGDRSRREDDRYLLLEALLSARDRLYISWIGHSIHDNSERAPSMLIGQLRDHLAQCWRLENKRTDADSLLTMLTTAHPLQPFSARYFDQAAPRLFSYQREWLAKSIPLVSAGKLSDWHPAEAISLRQLSDFVRDPVKSFFTQRLSIWFGQPEAIAENDEAFALDGLSRWQLQQQLLLSAQHALADDQPLENAVRNCLAQMQRRGALGMGAAVSLHAAQLAQPVLALAGRLEQWQQAYPLPQKSRAVQLQHQGLKLQDWLSQLRQNSSGQQCQLLLSGSTIIKERKYQWRHLVLPWLSHLLANTLQPCQSIVLSQAGELHFTALETVAATERLNLLLSYYLQAHQTPWPLELESAMLYLQQQDKNKYTTEQIFQQCEKRYQGDSYNPGIVQQNLYLQRLFTDFNQLTASGDFFQLAELLYRPLYCAVYQADNAQEAE